MNVQGRLFEWMMDKKPWDLYSGCHSVINQEVSINAFREAHLLYLHFFIWCCIFSCLSLSPVRSSFHKLVSTIEVVSMRHWSQISPALSFHQFTKEVRSFPGSSLFKYFHGGHKSILSILTTAVEQKPSIAPWDPILQLLHWCHWHRKGTDGECRPGRVRWAPAFGSAPVQDHLYCKSDFNHPITQVITHNRRFRIELT